MCATALPGVPSPAKGGPANQAAPPGGWDPRVSEVWGWNVGGGWGVVERGVSAPSSRSPRPPGAQVPAGVRVCALRIGWLPRGHRGLDGRQGFDCRVPGAVGALRSDNRLTWPRSPPQDTVPRGPEEEEAEARAARLMEREEGSVSPFWARHARGPRNPKTRASSRPESQFKPRPKGRGSGRSKVVA